MTRRNYFLKINLVKTNPKNATRIIIQIGSTSKLSQVQAELIKIILNKAKAITARVKDTKVATTTFSLLYLIFLKAKVNQIINKTKRQIQVVHKIVISGQKLL